MSIINDIKATTTPAQMRILYAQELKPMFLLNKSRKAKIQEIKDLEKEVSDLAFQLESFGKIPDVKEAMHLQWGILNESGLED